MPYLVKYVENSLSAGAEIPSLYKKDIKNGYKVVLVCTEKYRQCPELLNIPRVKSRREAKNCRDSLMAAFCQNGVIDAARCARRLYAECQIYTDLDGLYTADPGECLFARKLDKLDYDEALEMCAAGYHGINRETVEYCRRYGVVLNILSHFRPEKQGSIIKEVMGISGLTIKGVIKDPNICIISLRGIPDVPGISYRIFKTISDAGVVVDIINFPTSVEGRRDISLTVNRADKRTVEKVLLENQKDLDFHSIVINDNVAKVSVIGAALRSSFGVATTVFKILYENDINLILINTSEIKISVVVDKSVSDLAVQKIHRAFID